LLYISDGGQHDFKSLTSLKVEVNEYLRGKLERVSQKIDEVYSLDKKAWKELDVQEEKCGAMAVEIESFRDEMVGTVILWNYFLEVFQYKNKCYFHNKQLPNGKSYYDKIISLLKAEKHS